VSSSHALFSLQIRKIPSFYCNIASTVSFRLPSALLQYTLPKTGTGAYLQDFSLKITASTLNNLSFTSTESIDQLNLERGDTFKEAIVISNDENERVTGLSDKKMIIKKKKKEASKWNSFKDGTRY
jgi:hypothetical protein